MTTLDDDQILEVNDESDLDDVNNDLDCNNDYLSDADSNTLDDKDNLDVLTTTVTGTALDLMTTGSATDDDRLW